VSQRKFPGNARSIKGTLSPKQIKDLTNPDNSSYRAAIYRDKNSGKVFLAFRGTQNMEDIWQDVVQGAGGKKRKNDYYEKAKQLASALKDAMDGTDNLEIVGIPWGAAWRRPLASSLAQRQLLSIQPAFTRYRGETRSGD